MVGSGTPADPKRPQYAPLPPSPGTPPSRAGILAAGYLTSDDGKYALVEFVAADRAAFAPILADKQVKAFEKGKAKKADIEAEFRRHKKELKLEQLIVRVP